LFLDVLFGFAVGSNQYADAFFRYSDKGVKTSHYFLTTMLCKSSTGTT
jgi:hypothetical protein